MVQNISLLKMNETTINPVVRKQIAFMPNIPDDSTSTYSFFSKSITLDYKSNNLQELTMIRTIFCMLLSLSLYIEFLSLGFSLLSLGRNLHPFM